MLQSEQVNKIIKSLDTAELLKVRNAGLRDLRTLAKSIGGVVNTDTLKLANAVIRAAGVAALRNYAKYVGNHAVAESCDVLLGRQDFTSL